MLSKIAHFIESHRLLQSGAHCVVALSGGADSVALLLVLKRLGYRVDAAHCNFHLRGEESNRDEHFCVSLCQREDVPLHRAHFDTRVYASLHKVSIEMAARTLRYHYFEQLRKDIGADAVCVAHHRDDQAETILMNIIRGTGLKGLTGMSPLNGHVVRPFLCVGRKDIVAWLAEQGQDYVTDSTNLHDDVVRNQIRLNVIPLLERINPSVSDNINRMSQRMVEIEKVVDAYVRPMEDLSISNILSQPSPEYALYVSLKDYGFSPAQIEQIASSLQYESGREWRSATHQLVIDRNRLLVGPLQPMRPQLSVPEPGTYVYDETTKFRVKMLDKTDDFCIERSRNVAILDADRLCFPLLVRPVQNGDRFVPLGMRGSKLLSDYMTDRKFSLFDKRRQLVIVDGMGEIVWVVAERPSEHKKITDDTQRVVRIELIQS